MLSYIKKDVTAVEHGIVAHGCNCQGVMGSGVALAIKHKWPAIFTPYVDMCRTHNKSADLLGIVLYDRVERNESPPREVIVANIFTQQYYGRSGIAYANLEAVATGLDHVMQTALERCLPVYMPRIGCGLGGLDWDTQVGPIVKKLVSDYPSVEVYVCDL
jgi:O-acetyl-ADP-ribose deacetylase (regulator of RNase III)